MGNNSKIEWTHHTFNPWWGCMKVSEGCKNCYAETWDKRWGGGHWGPMTGRRLMSEDYWQLPLAWNARAARTGIPMRVFCGSMCDIYEYHSEVWLLRQRLFELIDCTPWLRWILLTKRPENLPHFSPPSWIAGGFPPNVWLGVSAENQEQADSRIPLLLDIPCSVRVLCCEPLLGPVDVSRYLVPEGVHHHPDNDLSGDIGRALNEMIRLAAPSLQKRIHWVIAGGESGAQGRVMHPDWIRLLHQQCQAAGVPFFFKQWGQWGWCGGNSNKKHVGIWEGEKWPTLGLDAGDQDGVFVMISRGKKRTGRKLGGKEWLELPEDSTPR